MTDESEGARIDHQRNKSDIVNLVKDVPVEQMGRQRIQDKAAGGGTGKKGRGTNSESNKKNQARKRARMNFSGRVTL